MSSVWACNKPGGIRCCACDKPVTAVTTGKLGEPEVSGVKAARLGDCGFVPQA